MIMALLFVPLQGLMATSKVYLSNVASATDEQFVEIKLSNHRIKHGPSCGHCKQHNCQEKHQCNNGQCFSASAIFLYPASETKLNLADKKPHIFKEGLVIPPLSSLFRPPKKLIS